jgi:hypothetical protein
VEWCAWSAHNRFEGIVFFLSGTKFAFMWVDALGESAFSAGALTTRRLQFIFLSITILIC